MKKLLIAVCALICMSTMSFATDLYSIGISYSFDSITASSPFKKANIGSLGFSIDYYRGDDLGLLSSVEMGIANTVNVDGVSYQPSEYETKLTMNGVLGLGYFKPFDSFNFLAGGGLGICYNLLSPQSIFSPEPDILAMLFGIGAYVSFGYNFNEKLGICISTRAIYGLLNIFSSDTDITSDLVISPTLGLSFKM